MRAPLYSFSSTLPLAPAVSAQRLLVLALLLTLAGAAADQAAVPVLFSTSPLCAVFGCFLLVSRRGSPRESGSLRNFAFSKTRVISFLIAHAVLIAYFLIAARAWGTSSGNLSLSGWLFLFAKLAVLAPGFILLPWKTWYSLIQRYSAEFTASVIILVTFFPRRIAEAVWPWYGQVLGHTAYIMSWPFVHGLRFVKAIYPTLSGPDMDVTILLSCSGISGLELFDILFAVVAFLDWNRLNKRRLLLGYIAGMVAMTLSNLLRITSFVVLGNNGFAELVSRFHINAGWLFFSVSFVVFLSFAYRWMLEKSEPQLDLIPLSPSTIQVL
jgi:exosortase/archaeosortase family protein